MLMIWCLYYILVVTFACYFLWTDKNGQFEYLIILIFNMCGFVIIVNSKNKKVHDKFHLKDMLLPSLVTTELLLVMS